MPKQAAKITISKRQRAILEALCRAQRTPQALVKRIEIVLKAETGATNTVVADCFGTYRRRIQRWRDRWFAAEEKMASAEQEGTSDKDLKQLIIDVLSDDARSGTPVTFTPEQITDIIALACEKPEDSGLPVSHWTPPELTRETIKRGIVDRISPRHLDRFLKRCRPQASQIPILADVA